MTSNRFRFLIALCAAWMPVGMTLAQEPAKPAKPESKPAAKPADSAKPGAAAAGQPSAEEMAMMETMIKAGTPGEHHAKLKPMAGKWTYVTKWRMSPEQPWSESPGKAEYRWMLGERVMVHEAKNDPGDPMEAMFGGPFQGFGLTGYDNVAKKYWNIWTDSMSTGMMVSYGTADASGKTLTFTGEYHDPMTGKTKAVKTVTKIVGDDKVVFEMHDKLPDGKEFQNLEVTYTRQK